VRRSISHASRSHLDLCRFAGPSRGVVPGPAASGSDWRAHPARERLRVQGWLPPSSKQRSQDPQAFRTSPAYRPPIKSGPSSREGNAGRLSFWLAGGGEFTSPFFFRWPSLTEAFAIRPLELRLSIPGWLAAIRFARSSATSQLNRGSASCPARRGASATWTKHAIGLVYPSGKRSILNLATTV